MKKIIIGLIACLLICGCNKKETPDYTNLSDKQIEKIMSESKYVIIDVRTKEEFDELHVVGAINIPYDAINSDIEVSKDTTVFVYCRSGNRSKIEFNKLNDLGYTTYDLGSISEINLSKEQTEN